VADEAFAVKSQRKRRRRPCLPLMFWKKYKNWLRKILRRHSDVADVDALKGDGHKS
jgi:hypothetical protein